MNERVVLLGAFLLAFGCGGSAVLSEPPDGGPGSPPLDGGVSDPDGGLPDAGAADAGADAGTPPLDGGADASDPRWAVLARPYLDSSATSASAAYEQDPWDQKMVGVSGGLLHPFFTATMFGCTDQRTPAQKKLACPAALSEARTSAVRKVVLHNTLESLPDTVSIFHRNRPFFRTDRSYPVSIHYVLARDGTIVEMVPESRVAYHSGTVATNQESIGIEIIANVGQDPSRGNAAARTWSAGSQRAVPFSAEGMTLAQYRSLLALLSRLTATYRLTPSQILSHRDVSTGTSCPGSIWRSGTTFSDWKSRDLAAHTQCLSQTGNEADFSRCLK